VDVIEFARYLQAFDDRRERGGPQVNGRPEHQGFGSFLARLTAAGQLGDNVSYDWCPQGLTFSLSAPVARLSN
jgi:two-component system, chemotaxis family, CheB/CheR fusion protein